MSAGELACTYACLVLYDDGIPITAEKISTLIKAANVQVESYWSSLFAKLCEKRSVEDLIMNVGGGAAPVAAAVAVTPPPPPQEEEKKEDNKEEAKDESDDENMFSLFD